MLVVVVYVDDLVITRSSQRDILKLKTEMKKMFKMTDMELLHYYLGIEVRQEKRSFT
jgi:hypothetical protein